MFLQNLRIENVRSLEDVELSFRRDDGSTRQWSLLLGENGCGKSTVLRCAALLLAGPDALTELLGLPDSWIRNGAKSCRISATLVTQKMEVRELSLTFSRGQSISSILRSNAVSLQPLVAALERSEVSNYPVIGYGASRRLASGRGKSRAADGFYSNPRANAMATLFSADAPLNALDTWAMDLHYRQKAAGLRLVKEALDQLLPGMEFDSIDREAGTLMFKTPDGPVPLNQLSDGYQNMAGWCGDLLYRLVTTFGHRKNPLAARGLLLVDEIDLHLHPVWQRKLRSFLAEKLKNFQVLATTHSPLTAQQSEADELMTLERHVSTKSVSLHHYAGAANLLSTQQLLASPVFGMESTRSAKMQSARQAWRAERSTEAAAVLATEVRPTLMPEASRTQALLGRIEKELQAAAGNPIKRKARK
jgi:ABC-type multidrug transport system ATPase subunit